MPQLEKEEMSHFYLDGDAARGARISFAAISLLASISIEAARRIIRLQAEGRSNLQGAPIWLSRAADMDLIGLGGGSTKVFVESPPLKEVAPIFFDQKTMWGTKLPAEGTAFSLLAAALQDASNGNLDSDLYDNGVLSSFLNFKEFFHLGFKEVTFYTSKDHSFKFTTKELETIEQLSRKMPDKHTVIISGVLDELKHSLGGFELKIAGVGTVRGLIPVNFPTISELWGKEVTVEGMANFKANGSMSLLEAKNIYPSTSRDQIHRVIPKASEQFTFKMAKPKSQKGRSLAEAFGEWPDDTPDDAIDEILSSLK